MTGTFRCEYLQAEDLTIQAAALFRVTEVAIESFERALGPLFEYKKKVKK
jgi:hypothetical protein